MFKGEKTNLFWAGLLLLGFASVVLFSILWVTSGYMVNPDFYWYIRGNVPVIVGGIVFILIGLYMMKSGVKKEQLPTQK